MKIAVDAMGGDHGPSVVIPGALQAAREFGLGLTLVGRQADIDTALAGQTLDGLSVDVIDTPDVIEMDEHPAMAVRRKPNSSISMALKEVKSGRADAMMSAGNSGAVMAAALAVLGRIPGVERPALAAVLPTLRGNTILVDLGAVTDPKASHLVQFAQMARVYAEAAFSKSRPTIALLSTGEEPGKGNQLVQEVYPILEADPQLNFVGNCEGKEILRGSIDVIVTDGFSGNIALKSMEGTVSVLSEILREEVTATLPRKLLALALKPAFTSMRRRLDYAEIGGAPLLGVNGVAIVAHGRSDERAIKNAVRSCKIAAEHDLARRIREALAAAQESTTPA